MVLDAEAGKLGVVCMLPARSALLCVSSDPDISPNTSSDVLTILHFIMNNKAVRKAFHAVILTSIDAVQFLVYFLYEFLTYTSPVPVTPPSL
jgi:hypothetical protein